MQEHANHRLEPVPPKRPKGAVALFIGGTLFGATITVMTILISALQTLPSAHKSVKATTPVYPVKIDVTPANANLSLNHQLFDKSRYLTEGLYELTAEMPGYETLKDTVYVSETMPVNHFTLIPLTYRVMIKNLPEDAEVLVSTAKLRYQNGVSLPSGNYYFEVKAPGYETATQWIEVKDSDLTPEISLRPSEDLSNQLDLNFVNIPAGRFYMGSDDSEFSRPRHNVSVQDFSLMQREISQAQWIHVMGENPSEFKDCGDDCPVENVSFVDVQRFIRRLNAKSSHQYRLPTEAEWEYAARAGKSARFSGGNKIECSHARYGYFMQTCGTEYGTVPVGRYAANPFKLQDMFGNVAEWVEDCWSENYYNAPNDGSARESGDCHRRVVRGGSWFSNADGVGSGVRDYENNEARRSTVGFRLVRIH